MLEDATEDILRKAMRGLNLTAEQCGLPSSQVTNLSEDQLRQIAEPLQLDANKLINLHLPFKHTYLPTGLHCLTSDFGELGVNCFVLHHHDHILLFDTGTQFELIEFVEPTQIFITHNHPDHTAGLKHFSKVQTTTPNQQDFNTSLSIGDLTIEILEVSGHCTPAAAYYITGLSTPVCIVGDSLFRRSMGGCTSPELYQTALANNRQLLQNLPPETILGVGHGPNTTIAEELESNPFF